MGSADVSETLPATGTFIAPILFRPDTGAAFVHLTADDAGRGRKLPSLTDIFPIPLSQSAPLLGEMDGTGGRVLAVGWSASSEREPIDSKASAWIGARRTGETRSVVVRLLSSQQQGARRASIYEMEIPPLASGAWTLTLALAGRSDGESIRESWDLSIK